MPSYTYKCPNKSCEIDNFVVVSSVSAYKDTLKCPHCGKKSNRDLMSDIETVIDGGDGSPKTVGAWADKQGEKLSEDQKDTLYMQHNAYKFEESKKELPAGMERMPKPKEPIRKHKWV